VAAATLLSRLLGLCRVVLEAKILGGGVFASAWQLAFMVPNLFRRLLGEGALGTALVPLLAHSLENESREKVKRDLAAIFSVLSLILAGICIWVAIGAIIARHYATKDYWQMALGLIPLLMPYALFICLIGIIGSILNTVRVYFLPAAGALLLNIFIIACLLMANPAVTGLESLLVSLSWAVLWSGAIQLLLMLWLLYHCDLFPTFGLAAFKNMRIIAELWRLALPGIIGASALQISFVADRVMASYLGPQAVPALTYTDRLIDLPIGIFAISFGAVLLTSMSRAAAKGNKDEMFEMLAFGLRHVLYICVPIAVFIVLFRYPLFRLLCMRGSFTESDLRETAWAALFYGCGIPSFVAVKLIVSAFYARKDMKTPLKISLFCICVNIVLNLILMYPLQQGGIALATVISSLMNNSLLLYFLRKHEQHALQIRMPAITLIKALIAASIAGTVYFIYPLLANILVIKYLPDLIPVALAGMAFCLIYFVVTLLLKCYEPKELISMFRRN